MTALLPPITARGLSLRCCWFRGIGTSTVRTFATVAEVGHGAPWRFIEPARFSLAHGEKDWHPYPVPTRMAPGQIAIMKSAVHKARLGNAEERAAIRRLDDQAWRLGRTATDPFPCGPDRKGSASALLNTADPACSPGSPRRNPRSERMEGFMTIQLDLFNAPALSSLASTRGFITKIGERVAGVRGAASPLGRPPAECAADVPATRF